MLVVASHVHGNQFWASTQQDTHLRCIARLNRLGEPCDICAVDKCFEFGPTLVTVGTRQYALCVVEGERYWIGPTLELMNFHDSGRLCGAILLQEILGLLSQLLKARLLGKPTRGIEMRNVSGHDDLLSSHCPASA